MAKQEEDDGPEDWAVEIDDPTPRADGRAGPPDDWPYPSWFSRVERDWFWQGQPDPCPVRALGHAAGEYIFVTAAGEIRRFTSGQLHHRGGLADLFGGSLWWPLKHFRKFDLEKEELTGGLQRERCVAKLMQVCILAGFQDGSRPHRGVGTWRGPDGRPIVHAGGRIFVDGRIERPGVEIGDAVFVIGGDREAPAYANVGRDGYEWLPAGPEAGRTVQAHLDEWHWESPEARDLFQGSLHCNMLGAAPLWLPHVFVRAPYGSGKSSLLRYARTVVGGAAHPLQRTYSKAFLEQRFSGTAAALFLDEVESDAESRRISNLFELVRLLSDDGAEGGRGTASGKSRQLDVHGTVTMAATVSEEWRPQDRSRIAYLELRRWKDRVDRPPAPPEFVAAQLATAAGLSAGLRARAIALWAEFQANLAAARKAVLEMGGAPRDADQLGHLIAGWWTMTSDKPLAESLDVAQLERFRPFIVSLAEEDDGEDEASNCLNTIYGLSPDKWIGGERVTMGQAIALAREDDGAQWRRTLLPYGLMLQRNEGESWREAWLCIANRHPGLDELLAKYPAYQGKKRRQILGELRRTVDGVTWEAKRSEGHVRIGGTQTRYLLVPPVFLPSKHEEAF